MSLPESLSPLGTVVARWKDFSGDALTNDEPITLTPTARLVYDADSDYAFIRENVELHPDSDGFATASVIPTNDAGVTPSGWAYRVRFPRRWGVPSKNIFVPSGQTVDIFAATGVVPAVPAQVQYVQTVNGIAPDETGDVTIGDIGGGDDYLTQVEADGLYAPISHTHSQSQVVGLSAALTSLGGSVTAAQASADTAQATAEDAQSEAVSAAAAAQDVADDLDAAILTIPARLKVRQAYITDGPSVLPDTSSAWQPLAGFTLAVPAVAGDYLSVDVVAMRNYHSGTYLDTALVVSGVPVRYLSTGAATPAVQGDPTWYAETGIGVRGGSRGVLVTSGDLQSGNAIFAVMLNNNAEAGILYASEAYPFYWRVINYGPVD